jgi:hypothetical protein
MSSIQIIEINFLQDLLVIFVVLFQMQYYSLTSRYGALNNEVGFVFYIY